MTLIIDGIFEENDEGHYDVFVHYLKERVYLDTFDNIEDAKKAKEEFVKNFKLTDEEYQNIIKSNKLSMDEIQRMIQF